jgi:hypothetical protein
LNPKVPGRDISSGLWRLPLNHNQQMNCWQPISNRRRYIRAKKPFKNTTTAKTIIATKYQV